MNDGQTGKAQHPRLTGEHHANAKKQDKFGTHKMFNMAVQRHGVT